MEWDVNTQLLYTSDYGLGLLMQVGDYWEIFHLAAEYTSDTYKMDREKKGVWLVSMSSAN